MAKKRKLVVDSEPVEPIDGAYEQELTAAAAGDEILVVEEEKPQVVSEAMEIVPEPGLTVSEDATAATVDGEDDAVFPAVVAAGDGDGVGDAVPEAVVATDDGVADAVPEAVASAVNGGGDGDVDGDVVLEAADCGAPPETVAADGDGDGDGDAASEAFDATDVVDDEPEPIQKLLEPLTKEQLIDLLHEAAERHADVMEQVQRIADEDPVHRKIFVHGLGWDTKSEILSSFFRQYGEIEDCNVVIDKISGKSKGYGFILFKHRGGARKALKNPQKKIGNRMTACQMASAGPVPPPAPPVSEYTQRKIYVSNVSAELDPHKLLQFFSKYGEIEEGPLGLDKHTGKPKGFSLFVYKTVDSAKKALEEPHKNFEGHILHCQKAIDGPKPNKLGFHSHPSSAPLHHGLHYGHGAGSGAQRQHFTRGETTTFGHLMAPSGSGLGFNQGTAPSAAAAAGLNPALGQALASLLTTPGAGLGLTNLLGSLGATGMAGPVPNQGVPSAVVNSGVQSTYGTHSAASHVNPSLLGVYGGQAQMQGGYGSASMPQGAASRGQKSVGHLGGIGPYGGH